MKAVLSEQMRELDRRTIEEHGIPGEVLMETAGVGVAESVLEMITASETPNCKVLAVAGHGNNGGDAFVAARVLNERGIDVEVMLCSDESRIQGDARLHFERMRDAGVNISNIEYRISNIEYRSGKRVIVLDGVLGTGIEGEVRGAVADAIGFINELGEKNPVVAIDVPSGMNADTGEAQGVVVVADRTVTMGLPKLGLLRQAGSEFAGSVEVVDIGIPEELTEGLESDLELIDGVEVSDYFERRGASTHKGTFGHVLVIGGAKGYAGAIAMAAMGALRSGAGLVTAFVPEGIAGSVEVVAPEVMVHPAGETETGSISAGVLDAWSKGLDEFDAILVGPGMTAHADTGLLVRRVIAESKVPVILDADALNVLSGDLDVLTEANCEIVVTPHPGEMARLTGVSTGDVQSARVNCAVELAERTGVIVVLKGVGTVVAGKGRVPKVNKTGNPGMGTGGMGDVLAGLMVGFAADMSSLHDAASASVYIHGRAGDLAALSGSQATLVAGDVLDVLVELPAVFRDVCGR